MNKRRRKYLIGLAVAIFIIWVIADAVNEPGVQDLPGNFAEVAFYRNENNTGPIVRIYAVTLSDTLWQEMEQYGNYMPHTKYGNTKVYFFREGQPVPTQLNPGNPNFPVEYQKYCLGLYEKEPMGQVSFRKYPFL